MRNKNIGNASCRISSNYFERSKSQLCELECVSTGDRIQCRLWKENEIQPYLYLQKAELTLSNQADMQVTSPSLPTELSQIPPPFSHSELFGWQIPV